MHAPRYMRRHFSIGIGIGAAAADTIGYRAPAQYRSNPSFQLQCYLFQCTFSTIIMCFSWLEKHNHSYIIFNKIHITWKKLTIVWVLILKVNKYRFVQTIHFCHFFHNFSKKSIIFSWRIISLFTLSYFQASCSMWDYITQKTIKTMRPNSIHSCLVYLNNIQP